MKTNVLSISPKLRLSQGGMLGPFWYILFHKGLNYEKFQGCKKISLCSLGTEFISIVSVFPFMSQFLMTWGSSHFSVSHAHIFPSSCSRQWGMKKKKTLNHNSDNEDSLPNYPPRSQVWGWGPEPPVTCSPPLKIKITIPQGWCDVIVILLFNQRNNHQKT